MAVQPFSRVVAVAVLAVLVRLGHPAAQQTTFRAGVDLVDVDVSVLDQDRRPVRGLTAADFTVYEDGRARPIVAFTPVDLPPRLAPTAPWMDLIGPDVATNRFPPEGRLVVLMMDRFITEDQRPMARAIAEAAIHQLRQGDLAAVVFATHGIPQNFTSDRQRLLEAVRRPFATLPDEDAGGPVACFCGSCSLETIANVAEGMREVRQRRKILIIVGTNMSISPMGSCMGTLTGVRQRAFRALKVGNITVYAFDPMGLEVPTPGANRAEPPNYAVLRAASLRRQGNLGVLPGETGGRVVGGNTPDASVVDVFRESASYYVLGFPPGAAADGRYHEIKVKVARPNVILQARQGYYAPGGRETASPKAVRGLAPAMARAVAGVWPKTDLALTMQVVPFARTGLRDAELHVTIGARLDARGSRPAAATVEAFVGAFDRNGKALGETRQTLSVPVRAGGAALEYELPVRLTVKPGRYEVRAAIQDATFDASGSVYGYVDVPNYAETPVALSGILLHAAAMSAVPAGGPATFVPTIRREFGATERVTAFIREHQGLTQALMPGYLNVHVLDEADRRVYGHEIRILPDQFGPNRSADHAIDLPLERLGAGEYLLVVDVRHGNLEARRELRFRLR